MVAETEKKSNSVVHQIIIAVVSGVLLLFITNLFQKNSSETSQSHKDTITIQQPSNVQPQPQTIENHYYNTNTLSSNSPNKVESNENFNTPSHPESIKDNANRTKATTEIPDCQTHKTGAFVFKNNTKYFLSVGITYFQNYHRYVTLSIPPGAEKNTGDLPVGSLSYEIKNQDIRDETGNYSVGDYGKIQIEQCNTGRYDINIIKLPEKEYDPNKAPILP